MKANEVMLGDWVYNEVPCYVTAIYHNGTMDCQGDDWAISTDRVEPIPLTAEILEKNGYTGTNFAYRMMYYSEDGRVQLFNDELMINSNNEWRIHIDNEDMDSILYCELSYVHELQHALRLCGNEKEIIV